MRKRFYLLSAFSLLTIFLFAQQEDKSELEKERESIQKEIREIQDQYDKVKGQKKQIVGQYNLIDRKVRLQNRYISTINKELRMLDDDIYLSNVEIYRLNKMLDTMKSQYARSVVYAYKNRSTYDFLNFIFSASSFNDAIKRIAYLKSYRAYREQQVSKIKETQELIAKRKEEQLGRKQSKDEALKNQTEQMKVLESQKKEKDVVLNQLKSEEKNLEKQLAAKKKRDRDLQNAIAVIVRREIEAAKKKSANETPRNTEPVSNESGNTTSITTRPSNTDKTTINFNSEADLKLNANFESNKNKLPWPVDQGYVCIHFGPYQIGETKLKGENPGITICTPQPGVNVKAVFEGEVVGVFNIADTRVVTIRHGKYFTTYSNLATVNVSKGDNVRTGQAIGKLGADDESGTGGKLEFLLMIETKNVNPEAWLR